ncbi:MAG TPA: methyltransferase domain-containing protein [Candidatus Binatia bacterium]|jgi:SAM-dependent methyltransferase
MSEVKPAAERPYTSDFYRKQAPDSLRSAEEIVPLVLDLIQPKSVIDIGCGVGTWLSVFKEDGVEDVFGVDGAWVDKALLEIPEKQVSSFDLEKPFRIDRQFDLAMSLEVAEHRPIESAETFVDSLKLTTRDIAAAIGPDELFILVDEGAFGNLLAAGRRPLPFPEQNGEYWGPPPDGTSAIREIERLREMGVGFMVFTRQAFWWLEYYPELHNYLQSRGRRALANDRLVIFELGTQSPNAAT